MSPAPTLENPLPGISPESKAGIFADLKRLRHHETPIEKYKRKAQQRRRRR